MRRVAVVVAVLVGALAPVAGCGGDDPSAGEPALSVEPVTTATPQTTPPAFDAAGCQEDLGEFVSALEEIDGRLDVGMNQGDYSDYVGSARVAYNRIDFDTVSLECTGKVGVFAEQALNRYIRANNRWSDCISDIDCDTGSIEGALQAQWSRASQLIERARQPLAG